LHLGLVTCYDLRFAELFIALARRGVQILLIPAAFTLETGRDHWEILLRARAIETGCFVIAADQWGDYPPGRFAFGRSMIVDPWGTVIAQASDGVGVITEEIDTDRVAQVRRKIPSMQHRRSEVYGAFVEREV